MVLDAGRRVGEVVPDHGQHPARLQHPVRLAVEHGDVEPVYGLAGHHQAHGGVGQETPVSVAGLPEADIVELVAVALLRLFKLALADVEAEDAVKVWREDQGALSGAAAHVHRQLVQVGLATLNKETLLFELKIDVAHV